MGIRWPDGGYSAEVQIYLRVEGRELAVANLGPDFLVVRGDEPPNPGHGQIIIRVDNREEMVDIIIHKVDTIEGAGPKVSELAYA